MTLDIAKLKAAAEKAKDNFIPNFMVSTRDVLELIAALEAAEKHIAELEAAPVAPVAEGETAVMPDYPGTALTQRECYRAGWEDRNAMLNQPVSPAYKLPAGWIKCSERMPEVGDIVLTANSGCLNVGEMERSGANHRYFTSVVSGRELPATHWMPLPAAPGEEG